MHRRLVRIIQRFAGARFQPARKVRKAVKDLSGQGFTGRGKKPDGCHPESPLGVRDLHSHCYLRWYSPWHCRLPFHLPFLPSEISNLKFEIYDAFAFISRFAHRLIFSASSLAVPNRSQNTTASAAEGGSFEAATQPVKLDPHAHLDLIFVLAGRPSRKRFALELFRAGVAPQILLSVARFEVRQFKELPLPTALDLLPIAQPVAAPERHFFVLFGSGALQVERIAVRQFGTLREIEALSKYLQRHNEIRSVIVVTSAIHARRVSLCCSVLLPPNVEFRMATVPQADSEPDARGTTEPKASLLEFANELVKLGVYRSMLSFRGRVRT